MIGNYAQAQYATLMIQIASPDQFSALNVLGSANLNGFLDPVLLNGFVPTIGDSFHVSELRVLYWRIFPH